VTTEGGEGAAPLRSRSVVLATGVRPRSGGLAPSQAVLIGAGAAVAMHDFAGLDVAILGGGDNAFENYEFVRSRGARSARIHARTIRARREFRDRVPAADIHHGPYTVDAAGCIVAGRAYDRILVFYGFAPLDAPVAALGLACTETGAIATEPATAETALAGLYAIGEVAGRAHPCVVTAMADGIVAAKAIQRRVEGCA